MEAVRTKKQVIAVVIGSVIPITGIKVTIRIARL